MCTKQGVICTIDWFPLCEAILSSLGLIQCYRYEYVWINLEIYVCIYPSFHGGSDSVSQVAKDVGSIGTIISPKDAIWQIFDTRPNTKRNLFFSRLFLRNRKWFVDIFILSSRLFHWSKESCIMLCLVLKMRAGTFKSS